MKHFAAVSLLVLVFLSGCKVEPQPLNFGTDGCHFCKMTIMDKKFGGEVVTTKGKVFKFDDANCMINFLNTGEIKERDIAFRLMIDFSQPEKLIDANNGFFLKGESIKSPMASKVAAFEDYEVMNNYKQELNAIYLTWGELVTQFK